MSRSRSGAGLARQLGAGACRSSWLTWTAAEARAASRQGINQPEVATALGMCSECPVRRVCADWARLDRYTGLAAGRLWQDGQPVRWPPTEGQPARSLESRKRVRPQTGTDPARPAPEHGLPLSGCMQTSTSVTANH